MGAPTHQSDDVAGDGMRGVGISRRDWLLARLQGLTGASTATRGQSRANDREAGNEADQIARVQAEAKRAGLGDFGVSRTEHFLGLGDAPNEFRSSALKIC